MATPRHFRFVAVAVAMLATQPAFAGRSCETKKPTAASIERGLVLAERTHQALEAEHARAGTQVVLLARAGQDLTKYGLRYSHLGFAYRTSNAQGEPAWRVLHKLNQCGTAHAAIYRQGLGEFFLDDLWRHEAAWSTPAADVQARLVPLLRDDSRALRLHHKPYSIVSYAWGRKYQQSNQWAIETLALAMDGAIASREQAQVWLQAKMYHPSTLRLGPLTRLGGRISAANVAFDDHPDAKRFTDRIDTVTVDSVFAWLPRAGLGGVPVSLRLP
jgi:hypothetical protein